MEDVPDEDPRELIPFRVVGEGLINHLSHEHDLRLINDHDTFHSMNRQCNVCILPIFSRPNYVCIQDGCDFILHEICANLSKKKRHPSHRSRLTLSTEKRYFGVFRCRCCEQTSSGFAYTYINPVVYTREYEIDLRCASIVDGFVHKSHPHGELSISKGNMICSNCKQGGESMLKCTECEGFSICFCCATLPHMVKHKYDKHHLSLCYGENPSGEYWCEICEKRIDPHKWFYTCEECSSTLHIHCVLGETPYIRCGLNHQTQNTNWDVVPNNYASRPHCHSCTFRCEGPYVFKTKDLFFCSFSCIWSVVGSDFGIKMCNLRTRDE